MRFIVRLLTVACCILVLRAPPADAKRVALVIGNADYRIGRLANPVNDAEAVAATLEKQLKFDTVLLRKDLKRDGFGEALREMARASAGAELGVVFFAGHGIEVGGRNYLVPIDAALATPGDIGLEAIALDDVLRQLDGVTKLRLVILDACRNNPFPAAKRSTTRGLGRVEPDGGTLIAYAAKDGTTADDGKGRHSPFAAALLKRIVTPGLDVRLMFGFVSDDVKAATNLAQVPYLYGQLGGEQVQLVPVADAKPLALPPPPPSEGAETVRICREVESMSSLSLLAILERQHKGRPAGECVAARIEEVRKQQTAMLKAEDDRKRAESEKKRAEADVLRPGRVFRDCADVCPEMVVVPAGSFTMGSPPSEAGRDQDEGPQRKVTIARPFAVGKFEVTFAEWEACVAGGGCTGNPSPSGRGWGQDRRPVINVSWNDAKEYVGWLSRTTGKSYRLLSEAEWEYAARAGTTTRYAFGDTIGKSQAQFEAGQTVAVGSFSANAFGLHDMHGNVREWVEDNWHPDYQGAPRDGAVWPGGDVYLRVLRGGSWYDYPDELRSALRYRSQPGFRYGYVGFRVARTL